MKKEVKKILGIALSTVTAACLLVGCGSSAEEASSSESDSIKVALLTATGGLGDKSFNDTCWAGFQKAEQDLGVEIKVVEPQSITDYPTALGGVIESDFDFIMVAGNDWVETVNEMAAKYPEQKFGAINIATELDNIANASFSDYESGFLAGALAAKSTKTGKIGYIGGMDVPAIQRFYVGYQEGAAYADPEVEVIGTFVGNFGDPGKGQEFAMQLMSQDVDVIYHGAGKTGEGIFNAAKDAEDVYLIGCDSNQDDVIQGRVLTSTLKRVDVAAYNFIESVKNDTFEGGTHIFNLENGGISLTDMEFTKGTTVSDETVAFIEDTTAKIIAGEIEITDVFAQ